MNKAVFVTGGVTGTGYAIAERFAKEAGFSDIQFYGDWDLSPLTEKSDNIVAIIK